MSDGQEKVQEASPAKRQRAKGKGDVPLSQEAGSAAAYGALLVALFALPALIEEGAVLLRSFLMRPEDMWEVMTRGGAGSIVIGVAAPFALLFALPAVATVAGMIAQQSLNVAPDRIMPKISKIDPIKGAGKKFGPQALTDFLRSLIKASVVILLGVGLVALSVKDAVGSFPVAPPVMLQLLYRSVVVTVGMGFAVHLVAALIDLPIVRGRFEERLKMTRQEVKEEQKENEGDQTIKAQRRQRAEAFASKRMMKDVTTADVVVVNPTHYAVALKWDQSGEDLPRCVAKGTDDIALRLRKAAYDAGVPIREDAPAARSLYAAVAVGEPIKQEHFAAVAAALRFADRVRQAR
ncbi:MAG: EscU/YscU/HrcU family type III secretion system export apparatus switch protein [Parvularcula sp.]|jgi:flagellar biosynthetic protein FlhB|nr:EscU/YscU/HrcU family type III secretion system export apparatus switch protein [Parvularcula sp.]